MWSWEPNSGPLEKQRLLFLATEPSLQPPVLSFWDRTSPCYPGRPGLEQFSCFQLLIKPARRDWQHPGLWMPPGSLRDPARPLDMLVFPSNGSHIPIQQPQTWPVVGKTHRAASSVSYSGCLHQRQRSVSWPKKSGWHHRSSMRREDLKLSPLSPLSTDFPQLAPSTSLRNGCR